MSQLSPRESQLKQPIQATLTNKESFKMEEKKFVTVVLKDKESTQKSLTAQSFTQTEI